MSRAAVHSQSYPGHQGAYPATMKQGSGRREGVEEERPSRLLQMRDDYQRRLLKEKEEKMINMYEDHQKRNQERAERVTRGGGSLQGANNTTNNYPNSKLRQPGHFMQDRSNAHPRPSQISSSPSLREFFRERRELEAKGGYVPPIDQHYKQNKSRTSSSNSFHKTSAGVDRGQPLAPIHTNNRPTNTSSSSSSSPFSNKPRLVRHVNSNSSNNGSGSSKNVSSPETDENDNYKANQHDNRKANQRNSPRRAAPQTRGKANTQRPQEEVPSQKMSDFQKWQREQNKAREDRLKKANTHGPRDSEDFERSDEDVEGGRGGGDGRNRTKEQERMLLEKINQQQAELERMKKEREEEAEMERREAEKAAKQEAAERERRRRQQHQEESRRRREEEAEAKRDKEEQRRAAARAKDGDQTNTPRNNNRSVQPTPRHPPHSQDASSTPRNPPRTQRQQPPSQRRPRSPEEEDEDTTSVPGPGNEIYAQQIEGEQGGKVKLVPCKVCGRKFADNRVQKHQAACKKVQKKRKVLDPTQMRTEGTEMAKYISKNTHKQEPPKKKKADWRRQHEEFIANIRYAKQMQQMEQQGVSPRDLPPPPPSHNPDLVPCPHCGRTFNEQSAERHIPRCQQLKTRPAANTKRR